MSTCELNPKRFASAAAAGLRVFPAIARDKTPAVTWKEYAGRLATQDELARWDSGAFNVAVITGAASGIVALDVDSDEAQAFVDHLELPPTPIVCTGKGKHYYFKAPAIELRNRAGIAGQRLDLRAEGGYVIGAGSIHPSGRRYEWLVSPDDVPFADLPPQLLQLLESKRTRPPGLRSEFTGDRPMAGPGRFDRWLAGSQRDAVAAIRKAEEGARNDILFREGVRLANEVAGAGVSWANYAHVLKQTALEIGLDESEIDGTLDSCWTTGSERPSPWMTTAREWVYLAKPDVFYHSQSGEHVKVAAFSNRFGSQRVAKGPFHRFLLDGDFVMKVHELTYRPETTERYVELDGMVWLNTYRASPVTSVHGDWEPFEEFVSYLVPEASERGHLLKMIAWTVRHPGKKLRHALLLRSSEQGIGKTMLTEIWAQLLGEHNVRKTTTEEVSGQFQGFIKETLLVVLEELNWGVGPTGYNRMKDLITGDVAVVNEKFLPVRHWPNHASFAILTNLRTPLILEDRDRRFFYIDSPATRREPEYYAQFVDWWRGNIGVIRAFLETVDLSEFDPYAPPPMTSAKEALIADGREDLVKELSILIEDRAGAFNRDIVTFAEIETELDSSLRGKSKTQLRAALEAIGAVPLGQQRVPGTWEFGRFIINPRRASLWVIRNARYWTRTDSQHRGEEFGREEGEFALFDSLSVGVRHVSEWPADPQFLWGRRRTEATGH